MSGGSDEEVTVQSESQIVGIQKEADARVAVKDIRRKYKFSSGTY